MALATPRIVEHKESVQSDAGPINGLLDQLEAAIGCETVSIGDLAERIGQRGYGALLIVPALLEITPIGGVPGVPTVLAVIISLFAVQILFGRQRMWLPHFIEQRKLSASRITAGVSELRPLARRLDSCFRGRFSALTERVFVQFAALICLLLMLLVPPLEIVPFASSAPMLAVIAFGLALLIRDGVLMVVAILISGGAFTLTLGMFLSL
ncbi:MAG: exopolysaccharide biosynthesis protein [Granulosicoccus sp.]